MLKAIKGVVAHGKTCSWDNYLVKLVKANWEKCQESGSPIRFCSLLIWISMTNISPVGWPKFTSLSTPTMYNYSCFKIRSKVLGVPSPKKILILWLQVIKSVFHKWRVPQNIRWALPPTCHIELGPDHTKLWYVDGKAADLVNLLFYLMVEELFNEYTRQSKMVHPIPAEAKAKQNDILIPLIDGDKADQYEVELQMLHFVPKF